MLLGGKCPGGKCPMGKMPGGNVRGGGIAQTRCMYIMYIFETNKIIITITFNVSNFPYYILYANGNCLHLSSRDQRELINLMSRKSELLWQWFKANILTLNTGTTF